MAKNETKLDWITLNTETELTPKAKALWEASKAAYRQYTEAKRAFEAQASADIAPPAGFVCKFGYQFGKLSFALAPEAEERKPAKATGNLADYLRRMAESGARC